MPTFLRDPAGRLLNGMADYLLNSGRTVAVGEEVHCDGFGILTTAPAVPREDMPDHYDHERWTILSVRHDQVPCEYCAAAERARSSPPH